MSIVLNEIEWAENALETRSLKPSPLEALSRVARYLHQACGYAKPEVRKRLESFLISCDPGAVLVKWSDTLDRIVKACDKYSLIVVDSISVTESEMARIESVGRRQEERLAFTLLCVAKYWDAASETNMGWVNTEDSELMKMANVTTAASRRNLMYHDLLEAGMIQMSRRVDNLNVQVMFIDRDSPVVLEVEDFRNLGNQYHMYHGESFFFCENCGLCVKKKSNSQKYCPQCANEIYVKKSVESVMRQRGKVRK